MPGTLYQRLGGAERIAAIVEDSLDRHAVNPVLAPRLRGKDLPQLTQFGLQVFCAGAARGRKCRELGLLAAHLGMDVSERELLAAIDDIVAALNDQGVGPGEVDEVVALLRSVKEDAVRA